MSTSSGPTFAGCGPTDSVTADPDESRSLFRLATGTAFIDTAGSPLPVTAAETGVEDPALSGFARCHAPTASRRHALSDFVAGCRGSRPFPLPPAPAPKVAVDQPPCPALSSPLLEWKLPDIVEERRREWILRSSALISSYIRHYVKLSKTQVRAKFTHTRTRAQTAIKVLNIAR